MPQEGNTPTHWAAYKGHADVMRLLLGAGANKDAADEVGRGTLRALLGRGQQSGADA